MRARTVTIGLLAVAVLGAVSWWLFSDVVLEPVGRATRAAAAPSASGPVLTAAPHARPAHDVATPLAPPVQADGTVLVRDVEDRVAVTVVNAGTGEPEGGIRIGWRVSRALVTPVLVLPNSVSDAEGSLEVPRADVTRLLVLSEGWIVVTRSEAEILADRRLYVSRWLALSVVVSAASSVPRPFDPRQAQVVLDFLRPDTSGDPDKPSPYSYCWFMRHRFLKRQMVGTPDAEGRLTFNAAWGAGWTLRARAPGCRALPVEVHAPRLGASAAEVQLVLRPVPRVRGQVMAPDGRRLPGASVHLYAKRAFPTWEQGERFGRQEEYVDTGHRHLERPDGRAVVVHKAMGRSDAEGRFLLDIPFDGELTLATRADGMLFDLRRLASTTEDLDVEVQLTRPSRPDHRVGLRRHDEPLAPGMVPFLSDVTDPDLELPGAVVVEDSSVLAEELVLGREYSFVFAGKVLSLRWDGRVTIDLDDIEREAERSFELPR